MNSSQMLIELATMVIDLQQAESQFVDSKYAYPRCQNMEQVKERLYAKATAILDGQAAPIHPFHALHNDLFTWADGYFSPESGRLNTLVEFRQAINDFWTAYPEQQGISTIKYRKLLGGWARERNYIFNPRPLLNSNGQVVRRVNGFVRQMIFVQTPDQPLTAAAFASTRNQAVVQTLATRNATPHETAA